MKTLLSVFFALFITTAFAANPSFQNWATYVATNGSDLAQGTAANPLATLSNALARINGVGTIVVRGGDYVGQAVNASNALSVRIVNYPGEVPRFFSGTYIASNSFTLVSNGIYSTTMTAAFSNALVFATNYATAAATPMPILIQTNIPCGTNAILNIAGNLFDDFPPVAGLRESVTNHLEHYPLTYTNSLTQMTNLNGRWTVTGGLLYVKFANSNVAGGIVIADTNISQGFIYGGNPATELKIRGIRCYFYANGFEISDMPEVELIDCATIGSMNFGVQGLGRFAGSAILRGVDGALNMVGSSIGISDLAPKGLMGSMEEYGCFWHENVLEGSAVRCNVRRLAVGSVCYGGRLTQYGFIDDGSISTFIGCYASSNTVAGWQAGNSSLGVPSFQRLVACESRNDVLGVGVDDFNVQERLIGTAMHSSGGTINVSVNPTTHFVRESGSYATHLDQQNNDVIQGTGTTAANYVRDNPSYGLYSTILGQAFYVPAFATASGFGGMTFGVRAVSGPGVAGFTYDGHLKIHDTNATPASGTTRAWMVLTNFSDSKSYAVPLATWP